MNKTSSMFLGMSTVLASFALLAFVFPVMAETPNWDTTGDYIVTMEHNGADNDHDMTLTQDGLGNLTGNGGSPAGANTYLWTIEDGMVTGDTVAFTAEYTATADAVTPQTTMEVEGTIAADGTMSGTWSDNFSGEDRSGTWTTASGVAATMHTETEDADANNDGFIDSAEGTPFYGDIQVSFTETGDTSAASALALDRFPVANASGNYYYERTLTVSDSVRDSIVDGSIVIHGFDTDNSGAYDGEKESSIAAGVPFEATVPVACGPIVEKNTGGYMAQIDELNTTGVDGYATLTLDGHEVTVAMNVHNTSPHLAHAQHIHIGGTNECPPNTVGASATNDSSTVTVTTAKFIQGAMATADTANNADFPMTATWDAENVGSGSGSYDLSETNLVPYRAVTAEMTKGADYETKERVNGDVVGAQCSTGKPFALQGYTSGNSKAAAMAATPSMAKPSFTDMQHDKFVIVWNRDCSLPEGEIDGEVVAEDVQLEVTSIAMVKTDATANGSFADGWEYVFHITAPMDEQNLAMKFSDWMQTDGTATIEVADNMRISSQQADNGGATILLTADNVYSTPDLHMVDDLDTSTDGRQIKIAVEVAVPNGTSNGSYTTSYGVLSQ